ncbi:hypothetical protein [Nitrospirillum amazonense]|uniref:hypothetical protein n=1 Tax=Nitrospirillum amazonense TaxID=28077 RepID=UPI0024127452|nr:hypothetical protein [Nitrospirillum amazonense]MDG3442877.1 hypothetical protein [Nitrospirillum amazonense]
MIQPLSSPLTVAKSRSGRTHGGLPYGLKQQFASVKAGQALPAYSWAEVAFLRDAEVDATIEGMALRPSLPKGASVVPCRMISHTAVSSRRAGRRLTLIAQSRDEADQHLEALRGFALQLGLDGAHVHILNERSGSDRLANISALLNTRGHVVDPANRLQLTLEIGSGKPFGVLLGQVRSPDPRCEVLALCREGVLTFDLDAPLHSETLVQLWEEGGDEP